MSILDKLRNAEIGGFRGSHPRKAVLWIVNPFVWRITAILGIILILISLIIFTGNDSVFLSFVDDVLLAGFSPVQGFVSRTGTNIADFFKEAFYFRTLQEENERLQQELTTRENYRIQILELQKENYRLREMLDFQQRSSYELLPAEVIARDPSNWFETITIDRGSAQGVRAGMAVITSQGLAGSVLKVSKTTSRILLLTDSRRAVSAIVMRSREPGSVGVIEGFSEGNAALRMSDLPPDANIQPGDAVITSGLGGVFPKGLYIGTVRETGLDQHGLLRQALIVPAVDFNRLEEIFVVITYPADEEDEEDNDENN